MILSKYELKLMFIVMIGTSIFTYLLESMGILNIQAEIEKSYNNIGIANPDKFEFIVDLGIAEVDLFGFIPDLVVAGVSNVLWVIAAIDGFTTAWVGQQGIYEKVYLFGFEWIFLLPVIFIVILLISVAIRVIEVVWIG